MSVPWLNLPSIYGSLRVSYLRRQSAKFMAVLLKTSSSWMFSLDDCSMEEVEMGVLSAVSDLKCNTKVDLANLHTA